MLRYRGASLIRAGFIGLVLVTLVILIGLQPDRLRLWATAIQYQALFSEAGGIAAGNDVTVSGTKVGTVSTVTLDHGDALVTFRINAKVQLGSQTTAHIRTGSLLGQRVLTLESAGSGAMRPNEVIPVSRTSWPYSLTDAVNDVTRNTDKTDTGQLNQSLDTLSATLDQIAPQLGPTFDGLTRLSRALNDRNETLAGLLKSAADVTGILSERSQQVNTLIIDANDLLDVLVQRRQAIVDLLANVSAVSKQLTGLVHDNEQKLAPTLDKLNAVLAMLQRQHDNIAKALPGLAKYETTSSEIVSSGPFYNAFIPNLFLNQTLQPFLDYIWGFRNGTGGAQPPAVNDGPRAQIPFPYNGIPQPGDHPDHPPGWQPPPAGPPPGAEPPPAGPPPGAEPPPAGPPPGAQPPPAGPPPSAQPPPGGQP